MVLVVPPTPRAPRVAAWLSATSLLLGLPVEAGAAPPPEQPVEESDTAKAESIFRNGQTKYETADYVGAIELWTEAYGLVESTPENAAIKALLIFNLAQAHVKAFELDEDAIHLKQARALLDSYRSSLDMLYTDEAARADEQAKIDEKLAEIATKLEAAEAAEAEPEPEPEPKPEPVAPPPTTRPNPGNPLLFAGVGIAVLGVATGGVAITLGGVMGNNANDISGLDPDDLASREEQFARGARGNALLITGAVIAGVLVPTGIALIAVGARRNAEANRARQARIPSLAPGFGPGQAGLVLRGRF
ncbi:hypothetical protein ACNOYE_04780 [Nannocystaceae bacterium ST9]